MHHAFYYNSLESKQEKVKKKVTTLTAGVPVKRGLRFFCRDGTYLRAGTSDLSVKTKKGLDTIVKSLIKTKSKRFKLSIELTTR
jgi:hypothetical protein